MGKIGKGSTRGNTPTTVAQCFEEVNYIVDTAIASIYRTLKLNCLYDYACLMSLAPYFICRVNSQ